MKKKRIDSSFLFRFDLIKYGKAMTEINVNKVLRKMMVDANH